MSALGAQNWFYYKKKQRHLRTHTTQYLFGHNNLSCAFDQHDGYQALSIDIETIFRIWKWVRSGGNEV